MDLISILTAPEFIEKIAIGVGGAVVIKCGVMLYSGATNLIFANKHFTVSGVWYAQFKSYVSEKQNIEIVRFVQSKEHIRFSLQQFSTPRGGIKNFGGEGVLRVSALSAAYYAKERSLMHTGVIALTLRQSEEGDPVLRGRYAELELGASGNRIVVGDEEYVLRPMKLSLVRRLKLLYGSPCFKDFGEAMRAIQAQ